MEATVIPAIAVSGAFIVPIFGMGVYFAFLAWKTWHETALKRDLVARGYTAPEIIEIIKAGQDSDSTFKAVFPPRATKTWADLPNVPPAKPVMQGTFS